MPKRPYFSRKIGIFRGWKYRYVKHEKGAKQAQKTVNSNDEALLFTVSEIEKESESRER